MQIDVEEVKTTKFNSAKLYNLPNSVWAEIKPTDNDGFYRLTTAPNLDINGLRDLAKFANTVADKVEGKGEPTTANTPVDSVTVAQPIRGAVCEKGLEVVRMLSLKSFRFHVSYRDTRLTDCAFDLDPERTRELRDALTRLLGE
jgi:hypothetical protein